MAKAILSLFSEKLVSDRNTIKKEILEGDKKILDDFAIKNNKINQKYQDIKHILNEFTKYSSNIESKRFFLIFIQF